MVLSLRLLYVLCMLMLLSFAKAGMLSDDEHRVPRYAYKYRKICLYHRHVDMSHEIIVHWVRLMHCVSVYHSKNFCWLIFVFVKEWKLDQATISILAELS